MVDSPYEKSLKALSAEDLTIPEDLNVEPIRKFRNSSIPAEKVFQPGKKTRESMRVAMDALGKDLIGD